MAGHALAATNITFDYETGVAGYGSHTVTQAKSGESLRAVSVSDTLDEYTYATGSPAIDGSYSLTAAGTAMGETSVTFSLVSGAIFDLTSISFAEWDGQIETVTLTSSKGTAMFSLAAGSPGSVFNVAGSAGAANMRGITSFTVTASPSPYFIGFDDIALQNIIEAPIVTGISPTAGPTAGGTTVTITGTGLSGATAVNFGSAGATSYVVNSATQITATSPAGSAGTVDITVTTAGGTSATGSGDQFTYAAAPTVTGISPTAGPTAGGVPVTITGTNFTNLSGAAAVKFGSANATSYTVNSATQITATSPAGSAGTVDITVTTPGGTSATGSGDQFTYVAAPTVTGISPTAGPTASGTTVTITGTNLSGATAVKFGSASAASYVVNSATQITATSPAGSAGTVDITVTTAGGTSATGSSDQFTYAAAPTVTAVSPASGTTAGGATVTITGTSFTGVTGVTIGGSAVTSYSVDSITQITATTPSGSAGAANVVVTTSYGSGTGTGLYTYYAAPTVTGVSPNGGPTGGGTSVTITGTNFTGATAVTIGGTAATGMTVVSSTSITATTPAGTAGAANVAVTTPGGTGTGTGLYTYYAAPTVTGISPTSGSTGGGTSVTITGTNFTGATAVTIGGTAATGVTVVNATTITATTPAHAAGLANVVVTSPGGAGTGTNLFTYALTPSISSVSPGAGPLGGGTTVIITGTNFTGATAVSFGGTAATSFTVNSATLITATTPAGSAGAVNVAVTTSAGSGTGTNAFTYTPASTVTAVSPAGGPTAGGTSVTITGTNFTGATAVSFGGTAAASYTVNSATQITATTPAGSAGAVNVVVTTPGGTGTGTNLFTYYAAPTVTAISPTSGSTGGGTSVTITGTNFTSGATVTIGGTAATGVAVVSATSITATTPAGTAGAANVAVTALGGTGTGTNLFTYIPAPSVISVSPNAGPLAGGISVTITGTNFTGATSVTIGGVAATGVTVVNPTTITALAPAGTAGARNIVVTTPGGPGTGTNLFTYAAAPTVTSVTPNAGVMAGGTAVTITGANFTGATAVTIGGTAATGMTVVSSTSITATTPAGTAGAANVAVTAPGGTGTGTGLFTYITVPGAPTGVTATAGNGQATVSFTAPASNGGSAITTYTATSNPGGLTGTCAGPAACAITVSGLANGTSYTFTVRATNSAGTGAPSGASAAVTPSATPTAAAASMNYQLNTPATLDLAALISGTSIRVTAAPSHGTATVAGTQVTYTPAHNYFGTDAFTYVAVNGALTSTPAVVSVHFVGTRPDPTQDANVTGMVNNQAATAKRFWRAQIANFQYRLEFLHRPPADAGAGEGPASGDESRDRPAPMGGRAPRSLAMQNRTSAQTAPTDGSGATPAAQSSATDSARLGQFFNLMASMAPTTGADAALTANVASLMSLADPASTTLGNANLWGAGTVRIGTKAQPGGGAGTNYTTDGVSFGMDRRISDTLTVGFGAGYAHDKATIGSDGSGSTSNGTSIAAYGSYRAGKNSFVDALIGYGSLDLDSTRYVSGFDDYAKASRGGSQFFGSLTASYEYRNRDYLLSPYGRYDFAIDRLDAATENGAGVAALYYSSQQYTTRQVSLGFRGEARLEARYGIVMPSARVEYQHHMEGANQAFVAYADTLGTPYNLTTTTGNTDAWLLGVGSGFALRNGCDVDVSLQWTRSQGGQETSHALFIRVSKPLGK